MLYTYRYLDEPDSRILLNQRMSEPHLTTHPENGRAIERVVTGGSQALVNTPKQKFSHEFCKDMKNNPHNHERKRPGSKTVSFA